MKKTEAAQIIAYLNAAFVTTALEAESVMVYVEELALLSDPYVATEAAQLIVRRGDRFPTIKDFRLAYRSVNEQRDAERRRLEPDDRVPDMPEWVKVWWWARRAMKDDRGFPQQRQDGDHGWDGMTLDEYRTLRDDWLLAGSPAPASVRDILQTQGT